MCALGIELELPSFAAKPYPLSHPTSLEGTVLRLGGGIVSKVFEVCVMCNHDDPSLQAWSYCACDPSMARETETGGWIPGACRPGSLVQSTSPGRQETVSQQQ